MSYNPLDPDADCFKPPAISVMVGCIHCGEEYDSYRIEWRVTTNADGKQHGYWCCPIPGCGGAGFGFDIFPIDPDYRDENGEKMWVSDDEEEEDEYADVDAAEEDYGDPPPLAPPSPSQPEEVDPGDDEALPW